MSVTTQVHQDATLSTSTADKNSPQAFGTRMRYRLQDLIANPYSFVPSYAARYKLFQQYCDTLTPHQAYAMSMLLGPDNVRGYDLIPNTFGATFPDVHRVDLTGQVGWYYFAGNVKGTNGVEYGVLLMMFQYTLLPTTIAGELGLTPLENQVIDVQLAITPAGRRMRQATPPFFAGTSGDIEVADRLFVRAGGNIVDTPSRDTLYPMILHASGYDNGDSTPIRLAIDITLTSGNGYLLQGMDGCEPCIGGVGTRYYSIPNLAVDAARSTITVGDDVVQLESGTFWFDHQWGTGMVPAGAPTSEVMRAAANLNTAARAPGWEFIVMNFPDGSALTLNHLHTPADLPWLNQSGPTPPPVRPAVSIVGKYMDAYGTCFNVSGMLTIDAWARGATSPDAGTYPISNVWFPFGWTLEMCDTLLPERLRSLRLNPIGSDPSAMFFANTSQYCETPVTIVDANGEVYGRGFCESVGYASSTASAVALAGLPADVAQQINPVPPSPLLKLLSLVNVTLNKKELDAVIACGSLPPAARDCGCP